MTRGGKRRYDTFNMLENDPKYLVKRFIALRCRASYIDKIATRFKYSKFSAHLRGVKIAPERYQEYSEIITKIEKEGYNDKTYIYNPPRVAKKRRGMKCEACGEFAPVRYCGTVGNGTKIRGRRYRKLVVVFKNVGKKMCVECWGNER